jgi:DNA-binding IclR family transcriptional regulator
MIVGNAPIQTLTGGVGGRIPMGVGPGSVSMLATLDERAREAIISNNLPRYLAYPSFNADVVRTSVAEALRNGFAHEIGKFLQSGGSVAVAVPQQDNQAHLAISVAAHVDQLGPGRIAEIADTIRSAIVRATSTLP